ncbi:DNA/RNA polymerase [Yamadazyma tenuis ATCC 10573]|uniref:DNA/RNA polymerase n=1 Tax=Candida tenuis (strain ATCC 10573 / BCRC 21748 / CBS 615 / JCM 9827 / NBRC 10315 / NRRL Y-1498 / VKM Y-70) TaxID=590646 RepID=G3B6J0_CANTC|nr:DNA/RNA polymerase [Yamadazyma tenuis ATCC 10573]EGV63481.1 DNA/RNA polymerase [Yamadazyma tenuis ATCC 10573]
MATLMIRYHPFQQILTFSLKDMCFVEDPEQSVSLCDWDDLITVIGSNVVLDIRREIYSSLEYTTSAGISRNKNTAKLAGGFLKPDNQTIILNSQIPSFMKKFELNDINGMGGKAGDQILRRFNVPPDVNSIEYLNQLPAKDLSVEEYPNLYDIVQGDFSQPLRDRVEIKSMMSRKQMMAKNPIKTVYDSIDWIKTFAGDLCNRLEDLDEESGVLTRPRTVSVNIHIKGSSNSKQCSIPVVKDLKKLEALIIASCMTLIVELLNSMFDLARLNSVEKLDFKNIHPYNKIDIPHIHNIACIISNLAKLENSIDVFTTSDKSSANKKLFEQFEQEQKKNVESQTADPVVQPKMNKVYINKLFQKYEQDQSKEPVTQKKEPSAPNKAPTKTKRPSAAPEKVPISNPSSKKPKYNILDSLKNRTNKSSSPGPTSRDVDPSSSTYYCDICRDSFPDSQEHKDYHFALELSKSLN